MVKRTFIIPIFDTSLIASPIAKASAKLSYLANLHTAINSAKAKTIEIITTTIVVKIPLPKRVNNNHAMIAGTI